MRIAIIGCGYVANLYRRSLLLHPELSLVGVLDRDSNRAERMAKVCACQAYGSLEAMLEDGRVEMVVNLTNPGSHYAVARACLLAGKHVYTEKPLAMVFSQAQELVELAHERGLYLSSAPCTLLSDAAQTAWKAVRERQVGTIRLVYAEMDDGMLHQTPYKKWVNELGTPWPYEDEFATGCTIEHAGYVLTWLVAFFGPAVTMSAFSDCLVPMKAEDETLAKVGPDFSVACIRFQSGVVARMTCGVVAPQDRKLLIIGDEGIMTLKDFRNDWSPLRIRRYLRIRRALMLSPWQRRYRLVSPPCSRALRRKLGYRDFCRGIAEMASAIQDSRPCRLDGRFCLHVNELTLAIHNARDSSGAYKLTTSFDPVEPMPWAQS